MEGQKKSTKQRRLRLFMVVSAVTLLISKNLYYFYIKLAGLTLPLSLLLELLLFLTTLICVIILLVKLSKDRNWRNKVNYISLAIVVLIFLNFNFGWYRTNADTFQSKVVKRACYEGTMNTSQLLLRKNGTFEDFNVGFFGISTYSHGHWTRTEDTLFFSRNIRGNKLLADTVLIKNNELHPIQSDSLRRGRYYLGYCRREN